jgi:hypothetical protein
VIFIRVRLSHGGDRLNQIHGEKEILRAAAPPALQQSEMHLGLHVDNDRRHVDDHLPKAFQLVP